MFQHPTNQGELCRARFSLFANKDYFFLQIHNSIKHTNHRRVVASSKKAILSISNQKDTETMNLATTHSSCIALGVERKTGISMKRQEAKNIIKHFNYSFGECSPIEIDDNTLQSNSAESVKSLLHQYGCQVLILRSKREEEVQEARRITMEHCVDASDVVVSYINKDEELFFPT